MNFDLSNLEIPDDPDEQRELRDAIQNRLAEIDHFDTARIEAQQALVEIEREVLTAALAEIEDE